MAGERRVLTVGGKGSSLSPSAVFEFAIASPPQLLRTDPSSLSRLSSSTSNSRFQLSVPDFLTPEEARASILLLYNHLLRRSSSSASKLSDILNNDTTAQTLTIDLDFDGNEEDIRGSWPIMTLKAICALLDHTASSLTTLADAVAALSCEALKADTSKAFSLTDSGDGYSEKDMASVSSNLQVLLNGSKQCGNLQCDQVDSIPMVHGRLRSLYKSVHSSTLIALNSTRLVNASVGPYLTAVFSSLSHALLNLGNSSWHRANLCLIGLEKDIPTLVDGFNDGCPGVEKLEDSVKAFLMFYLEEKYVESLHEIYILAQAVMKILSWEATNIFYIIGGE